MNAPAFCTQCGSPLAPGTAFCTTCGAALASEPAPSGPIPQPSPLPAAVSAPGPSAVSTGMGLAAKLGLAALAVGAATGGTWLTVASQNTRATPAAQTTQNASGNATVPTDPPAVTVSGPAAVPYGEPAVLTVILHNTTALPVIVKQLGTSGGLWWEGLSPAWSPDHGGGASQETVEPGASFTWDMTYWNTRVMMDEYWIEVDLDGDYLGLAGYAGRPQYADFSLTAAHVLIIASPVRSLDSHWDTYCDERKAVHAAWGVVEAQHEAMIAACTDVGQNDPACQQAKDEENDARLWAQALDDERFNRQDEDGRDFRFTTLFDQYACDCWCNPAEADICNTIPWGTDAEIQEGPNELGTVPPIP